MRANSLVARRIVKLLENPKTKLRDDVSTTGINVSVCAAAVA
jgi:hypothetical protein